MYELNMTTNPSIVKWPGGKKQELKIIKQYLPKEFQNYYEPFVGGGSCYLNIESQKYFINDKCDDLINIYKSISDVAFSENLHQFDIIWQEIETISNTTQILKSYYNNSIQDYVLEQINSNVIIQNATKVENHIFQKELKKRLNSKLKNVSKLNENKEVENHDITNNIEASIKSAYYNYNRYLLNYYKAKLSIPQYSAIYFFIRDMAYSGMFRYCQNGNFNVPYGGIGYNAKRFADKKIINTINI